MATLYWLGTTSNAWGTAANWSTGSLPVDGDTVIFENNSNPCAASDQSAIELAALYIYASYTGEIGDRPSNANPKGGYLQIGATICNIGRQLSPVGVQQPGSPMINLDLQADASAVTVESTCAGSSIPGQHPVALKFNENTSTLNVRRGKVMVAARGRDEASVLASITMGALGAPDSYTDIVVGTGVTCAAYVKNSGNLLLQSSTTNFTQDGGTTRTEGSVSISGDTKINAGLLIPNAAGTTAALDIGAGAFVDFLRSQVARTVTNCTVRGNIATSLAYDSGKVTFTNPISGKLGGGGTLAGLGFASSGVGNRS